MTERERMLSGRLYNAQNEELVRMNKNAKRLIRLFNQTQEGESDKRIGLLKELLGSTGEKIWIEPPFHCDYGCHVSVGEGFYANYDCIILDVCPVTIGERVLLGPRVCIYTAAHPMDAAVRATGLEYGKPVVIGDDVWIGGNSVINPGVTVGSNTVIGSGSVVTRSIPSGVIAVGNPCRVLRPITDEDSRLWKNRHREYLEGGYQ